MKWYTIYLLEIAYILGKLTARLSPHHSLHVSWTGWRPQADSAKLILQGDYTSEELTDLQALLLHHCKSPQIDALSPFITKAEFISKFQSWTKRILTSPSGLHLGHYKALVACNDIDLTTEQ